MELLEHVTYHVMSVLIILAMVGFIVIPTWCMYDESGVPGLLFSIGFWIWVAIMLFRIHSGNQKMIREMRSSDYWQ